MKYNAEGDVAQITCTVRQAVILSAAVDLLWEQIEQDTIFAKSVAEQLGVPYNTLAEETEELMVGLPGSIEEEFL